MADFETVDTLELEIQTKAFRAAEKIDRLSASVADFGRDISKYVGDMKDFASALQDISRAINSLSGVKNLKSIMNTVASTVASSKAKAITGLNAAEMANAKQKMWLINGASSSVGGRTRVVQHIDGSIRKFSASSNDLAKEMNEKYHGSGYSNKALSAEIQAIRNMIIRGNNTGAMSKIEEVGKAFADSAFAKETSPMVSHFNDIVGKGFKLSVSPEEIRNTGRTITALNNELREMGLKFSLVTGKNDLDSAVDEWGIRHYFKDPGNVTLSGFMDILGGREGAEARQNFFSDNRIESPRQFEELIINELLAKAYEAEEVQNEFGATAKDAVSAMTEIQEEASKAKAETDEAAQIAKEEAAAWKSQATWEREQDKRYKEDFGGKNKTWQMEAAWRETEDFATSEAEGWRLIDDVLDRQAAEYLSEDDAKYSSYMGQLAEGIVADRTQEAGMSLRQFVDEATGVTREMKSAEESAGIFKEALDAADKAAREAAEAVQQTAGTGHVKQFNPATGQFEDTGMTSRELLEASNARRAAAEAAGREAVIAHIRDEWDNTSDAANKATLEMYGLSKENIFPPEATQELEAAGEAAQELTANIEEAGEAAGEAAQEAERSGVSVRGVLSSIGRMISQSILGQLAKVAKMRALRAVAKGLASGFSEGVSNMYQWSKGLNGAFAGAMDTFATKAMLAKNSIATAFAPAVQALVPLFSTVVSWINAASNAIAQFMALMTGQKTWTAAAESAQEWADATASGAGSTGQAAKAAKDLLADWDELNIIQSQTDSGSGGGGGGSGKKKTDYSGMFEIRKEFSEWTKYFKEIKLAVAAIGAGIAAWFVLDTAKEFLRQIGIAGDSVDEIFGRIKKGVAGAVLLTVGYSLASAAGKSYANNGFTWTGFAANIIGVIAAGIGGTMLASAFGINPVIGLVLGVGLALYGTVSSFFWQRNENEREYIRDRLESEVYGFSPSVLVEDLNVAVGNATKAREDVRVKLEELLTDIEVLKLGIDKDESWTKIYNDVLGKGGLLSRINTSLEEDANVIKMYYMVQQKTGGGIGTENEGGSWSGLDSFKVDMKATSWLEGEYARLGNRFAECFVEGEVGKIKEGKEQLALELAQQMAEATSAAEMARQEAQIQIDAQNKFKGMSAKDIMWNMGGVIDEMDRQIADARRQSLEEYIVTESGILAQLEKLGADETLIAGVKKNIEDAMESLRTGDFAKETAEAYREKHKEFIEGYIKELFSEDNRWNPIDFFNVAMADTMSKDMDPAEMAEELKGALLRSGNMMLGLDALDPTFEKMGVDLGVILGDNISASLAQRLSAKHGNEYARQVMEALGFSKEMLDGIFEEGLVAEAIEEAVEAAETELRKDELTIPLDAKIEEFIDLDANDAANEWWDTYRYIQKEQERLGGAVSDELWNMEGELYSTMKDEFGDGFDAFWARFEEFLGKLENPWGVEDLPDWLIRGSEHGATSFYNGAADTPLQVDAATSGMATDSTVQGVADTTSSGLNVLQMAAALMQSTMKQVEANTLRIANKDFSVNVYPTAAWGGMNAKSAGMRNMVTGENA